MKRPRAFNVGRNWLLRMESECARQMWWALNKRQQTLHRQLYSFRGQRTPRTRMLLAHLAVLSELGAHLHFALNAALRVALERLYEFGLSAQQIEEIARDLDILERELTAIRRKFKSEKLDGNVGSETIERSDPEDDAAETDC